MADFGSPSAASSSVSASAKALANLHSLLDPGKPSSKPLSGQNVMVPMTTKAFFPGQLQPSSPHGSITTSEGSSRNTEGMSPQAKELMAESLGERTTDKMNCCEAEMILVHLGQNFFAEMNRKDAADVVSRRLEAIVGASTQGADEKLSAGATSTSDKAATSKQNINDIGSKQADSLATNAVSQAQPRIPILPYVEIREEYDSRGKEVKAEAIDVTAELSHLSAKTKGKQQLPEPKWNGDTKSDEEYNIQSSSSGPATGFDKNRQLISHQNNVVQDESAGATKGIVSHERYDKITSRLEELAILEEEHNKNKSINEMSSKKIKGKGWAKGFLCDDGRKGNRKVEGNRKEKNVTRALSGKSEAEPQTNTSRNASSRISPADQSTFGDGVGQQSKVTDGNTSSGYCARSSQADSKKKVSFGIEDEVKLIPTSGRLSRTQVQPNMCSSRPQQQQTQPSPFEKDAFTGDVSERPLGAATSSNNNVVDESSQLGSGQSTFQRPPKKLSRFAQQRQRDRDM